MAPVRMGVDEPVTHTSRMVVAVCSSGTVDYSRGNRRIAEGSMRTG